ncbi:MAG: winged helix-turn-helix transcriptional regulator [Alphaproteobacteria bacterium]|nr:winged helix-turn-helix domain-containing protein [Alphaproteobacteria bacterium]MDE2110441.1 winged helix-turn-helix transcriptional regulator [Alphaproteobacteria bacterium]MDE2493400.1 winged helix-turn-helix transcriptional regulator [Alphaproteobacteria bacterium]
MSDVFDALAHPVRRKILKLLRGGAMSAGDLAAHFDLAKPTLSGHFTVLKTADLVTSERRGTTILYRLNMSVLEEALAALMSIVGSKPSGEET